MFKWFWTVVSLGAPCIMTVDFMKHSEAILKSVILDLSSQEYDDILRRKSFGVIKTMNTR